MHCESHYHCQRSFNNTGARLLDSIYHMILKLLLNRILGVKTARSNSLYEKVKWTSLRKVTKFANH